MTGSKENRHRAHPKAGAKAHEPEWAAGLKRLYESVVEEPIPDAFKELLSKLDSAD